jgi:hypothetical protein
MRTVQLTAPSVWASYLINGDASGIDAEEIAAADAWLTREGLPTPVDCEDAGFRWRHDAFEELPLGADCQLYSFLVAS